MNRNTLKTYAPQARREFIRAVTDRAALYGLTASKIEPVTEEGDVAVIAGKAFPRSVAAKRRLLEKRINRRGFEQVMEAMAYTWFNRFVAIRFMEIHGYLDHGYRVLSPSPSGRGRGEGCVPEILQHAEHVDLPGLNKNEVVDLKLDGTKEPELYRMLLLAQYHALYGAMPFLFESIDDETELLLPDNLLHSDSLIRKLVREIPEEDWQEVEIIGWLYQFYISEKKDEVIGKVVKSEDIPAATQLFTPNWIVKYLVQNSLGRQWVATYPNSPLKAQMEYYIEPAEQTPEVQAQLDEITPTSLNPEELTLLDPACGSGHILVEAYDLLKAIYQERGYRAKDIPRLILEKNLFGLEIDDRAAQLAAFALMMKARADDRNLFSPRPPAGEGPGVRAGVQPQVLSIQESKGLDAREITEALNQPILDEEPPPSGELFEEIADEKAPLFSKKAMGVEGGVSQADVARLIDLFEHGKTFGSLIQVPNALAEKLPAFMQRVEEVIAHGGMFEKAAANALRPLIEQARMLATKYHAIAANPPYMGSKALAPALKAFGRSSFPNGKSDLFAMFMVRTLLLTDPSGHIGLMTPFVWMFLQTYSALRHDILTHRCLSSLVHPEYHAFFDSAFVPICAFIIGASHTNAKATFIRLTDFYGQDLQQIKTLEAIQDPACNWRYDVCPGNFLVIPGSPIAYWIKNVDVFRSKQIRDYVVSGGRCKTHNDEKHVRFHWEVSRFSPKWRLYLKGGNFRRYYGNELYVVDWSDSARAEYDSHGGLSDSRFWGKEGITWSLITSSLSSFRLKQRQSEYSSGSPTIFTDGTSGPACDDVLLAYLNSNVPAYYLKALNPTLNTTVNDVFSLPYPELTNEAKRLVTAKVQDAIELTRLDWDSSESSWDFSAFPGFPTNSELSESQTIKDTMTRWSVERGEAARHIEDLQRDLNHVFIATFGLSDVLGDDPGEQYRFFDEPDAQEDIKRLLSYAIGCMMGRYSLDEPGLIYAHSGNEGFDPAKYRKFPADDDGIVPLTEFHWFEDDAAKRFEKFIATAWPGDSTTDDTDITDEKEKAATNSSQSVASVSSVVRSSPLLDENLKFVAESLGAKKGESPRDTIRRYLSQGFFKHHLKMYKKRPIYWLFSSGRERAFQCLVYLHRYNEGTLSRMRTEYVIPLQGKIDARIEQLKGDIAAATSTAHGKKLQNERDKLIKQHAEIHTFDEKLRHYADRRISLDLDDGVKVNYGKFGDLLAEVKAVTGKKAE